MKKKDIIKLFSSIMVIAIVSNNITYALDNESIESEINVNNDKIEALEEKKSELNEEISEQEEMLSELQSQINSKSNELETVKSELSQYSEEVSSLENEIASIYTEIEALENEISEYENSIAQLEEEEKETEEKISYRIRTYAKVNFTYQYIYMLVSSRSLSDVVQAINNINRIVSMDRNLIAEGKEKRKEIDLQKEIIKENLEKQEEMVKEIEGKQESLKLAMEELQNVQAQHEQQLLELGELENEKNIAIASLEEEGNNIEEQLEELTIFNEELQAQLDQLFEQTNNNVVADSGNDNIEDDSSDISDEENSSNEGNIANESGFIRPVSSIITEYFGPRINPVTGNAGNHNGIDFGSAMNDPIVASKGGVVSYAGYWGDFGNIVIINHENGIQTFYAHCNSIAVSNGQTVSQGQVIGYVGTTGMSTGPHLHFEIRINGVPVDPLIYINE